MRKILVVCLLGIGMLLPALQTTAREEVKKIVNCTLEDEVLLANSSGEDGTITKVIVTNTARQIVASQECGGYFCDVYLGDLPAGSYSAQIHTSRTGVHIVGFTVSYED
jgi:hypothetical protein